MSDGKPPTPEPTTPPTPINGGAGPRAIVNMATPPPPDNALGLSGVWKIAANFGGAVIIAGAFLAIGYMFLNEFRNLLHYAREDRVEERKTNREDRLRQNDEENRRAGEIKGALDKNTEVLRELIAEFKKRSSTNPTSAVPKTGLGKMAAELQPINQAKPPGE